jgi:hypothetical protein
MESWQHYRKAKAETSWLKIAASLAATQTVQRHRMVSRNDKLAAAGT